MFSTIFIALAAMPFLFSHAADHTVIVGANSALLFTPQFLTAAVGDNIIFSFRAKNHSAIQSSFNSPCSPLAAGKSSGFQPVDATDTDFPTFKVPVVDTKPLWFYCSQAAHCRSGGMVFAAFSDPAQFADASVTFNQFKAIAQGKIAAPTAASSAPATAAPTGSPVTVTKTVTQLPGGTITSASATPTSSSGAIHQVAVGADGLSYTPSNLNAKVGDQVIFTFAKGNHTITQSTFQDPCRKVALTSTTGQVGFDSGFMPASVGAALPTVSLLINDTAPFYAYCRQANHCGSGMVMTINTIETSDKSFASFKARAQLINGTAPATTSDALTSIASGAASSSAILAIILGIFL